MGWGTVPLAGRSQVKCECDMVPSNLYSCPSMCRRWSRIDRYPMSQLFLEIWGHSMPRQAIWVPTIPDLPHSAVIYSQPIITEGNEMLKSYLNSFRSSWTEKLSISRSAETLTISLSLNFVRTVCPIDMSARQVEYSEAQNTMVLHILPKKQYLTCEKWEHVKIWKWKVSKFKE